MAAVILEDKIGASRSLVSKNQKSQNVIFVTFLGQRKSKSQLRFKGREEWMGVVAKSHCKKKKKGLL